MLEQDVAAIRTTIENVYCAGVAIDIGEEVVTQKIDLDERFFFRERQELQLLHAYDLFVLTRKLLHERIIVDIGRLLVDRFGVQTLVEHARLVFAQLAKYFSSCNVDGSEEALFVLFDANDRPLACMVTSQVHGVGFAGFFSTCRTTSAESGAISIAFIELPDLFFRIIAQSVGDIHATTGDGDIHSHFPFVTKERTFKCAFLQLASLTHLLRLV